MAQPLQTQEQDPVSSGVSHVTVLGTIAVLIVLILQLRSLLSTLKRVQFFKMLTELDTLE